MLISELANRTDLPVHTIRFYEREGLIDDRFFRRGENGYRYYDDSAVERVEMIKQGQAAGYTLAEVRELMVMWDAGELTTDTQLEYLADKVDELTAKIQHMERIKRYLTDKIAALKSEPVRNVHLISGFRQT